MSELVDRNGEIVPVRWSWLSRFSQSPAHARHAALRGKDPTAAMRLGTVTHAVVFGLPVSVFDGHRRGKAWDAFKDAADQAGALTASVREYDLGCAVRDALTADPQAAPLLFGPGVETERNIRWARHGRSCSSTPDARKPGEWIVDLKTCRTAAPSEFIRAATRAGYPGQLAYYREADAFDAALDEPRADLYIVAVEPFAPFAVTTYRLDEYALALGERMVSAHWSALMACEDSDEWPGYAQSVVTFTADDPDATFGPLDIEPDDPENDNAGDPGIDWSAA